jgi:hypothetical protein
MPDRQASPTLTLSPMQARPTNNIPEPGTVWAGAAERSPI